MMWYSYWLPAKNYGAAAADRRSEEPIPPAELGPSDRDRLRGWLAQMTLDTSLAVGGTLLFVLAFLILGTGLLQPQGKCQDSGWDLASSASIG